MLKVLYAGSPASSAKTLSLLLQAQHNSTQASYEIVGVLSNPASAQGRHKTPIPTPVSKLALENNIPLFTPERLNEDARTQINSLNPDILICFAYGHIFGPKFLSLFKYGGINLHPSLLPKYRGPTPVNAAILNEDAQTAVTVQTLSLKMDEGDILCQEIISLNGTETTGSLLEYSAEHGAHLLLSVLEYCAKNESLPTGTAQQGTASYTKIITKEDCKINWEQSASRIGAHIRAYSPEPCAWTYAGNDVIRILQAVPFTGTLSNETNEQAQIGESQIGKVVGFQKKCGILVQTGDGILCVTKLQRQGKNIMDATSFMNGARNFIGTVLGKVNSSNSINQSN